MPSFTAWLHPKYVGPWSMSDPYAPLPSVVVVALIAIEVPTVVLVLINYPFLTSGLKNARVSQRSTFYELINKGRELGREMNGLPTLTATARALHCFLPNC